MSGSVTRLGNGPLKTRSVISAVSVTSAAASTIRDKDAILGGCKHHAMITGVTSRIPIASPPHHVNHALAMPLRVTTPANSNAATPIVALTIGARTAPKNVRATTSRARSRQRSKLGTRESSHAATTASSGLPTAVANAIDSGAGVVTFTRNAPSATPGQTRRPRKSIAATATPDGGHTSVTVTPTVASDSPSLPARKYAPATPTFHAISATRRLISGSLSQVHRRASIEHRQPTCR